MVRNPSILLAGALALALAAAAGTGRDADVGRTGNWARPQPAGTPAYAVSDAPPPVACAAVPSEGIEARLPREPVRGPRAGRRPRGGCAF